VEWWLAHRFDLLLRCDLMKVALRSWYDKTKLQDRFVAYFTGIGGGNCGTLNTVRLVRTMHTIREERRGPVCNPIQIRLDSYACDRVLKIRCPRTTGKSTSSGIKQISPASAITSLYLIAPLSYTHPYLNSLGIPVTSVSVAGDSSSSLDRSLLAH
jgi:hypothetical protein